jgi:hypothetical protein
VLHFGAEITKVLNRKLQFFGHRVKKVNNGINVAISDVLESVDEISCRNR